MKTNNEVAITCQIEILSNGLTARSMIVNQRDRLFVKQINLKLETSFKFALEKNSSKLPNITCTTLWLESV